MPPDQGAPARERRAAVLHGSRPRQGEAVDPRAEPREDRGQQRQRGREHERDCQQDPDGAGPERLARDHHHGGQRGEDGQTRSRARPCPRCPSSPPTASSGRKPARSAARKRTTTKSA